MPQLACWSLEDESHVAQTWTQTAAWSPSLLMPANISRNAADLQCVIRGSVVCCRGLQSFGTSNS